MQIAGTQFLLLFVNLVPRVLSLPSSRKYPGCGWSRVHVYKSNPHQGWVFDLILSKVEKFLSRGGRNCVCLFKMALSVGYTDIILKVKQVICLETLY